MIEITEEPYDGELAASLVAALHAEINELYALQIAEMAEAERQEDDAAYLAEVTPDVVRRPHGAFLVAWLDREPVACGAVKPFDGMAGVGEVKRMYTAPAARRRGISRAVLARLELLAGELGYHRLQLETGSPQHQAVGMYESAGWARITPYGHYKDSPESICFAKDLSGA